MSHIEEKKQETPYDLSDDDGHDQHSNFEDNPPENRQRRSSLFGSLTKPFRRASTNVTKITVKDVLSRTQEAELHKLVEEYDKDGDGVFSNEEVYDIFTALATSKEKNRKLGIYLVVSAVFISILSASNIGTAFLAVNLAKEAHISGKNEFVSAENGERVGVLGQGVSLDIEMVPSEGASGERNFCVPTREWANLWYAAETGSNILLRASDLEDDDKEEGIQLLWQGSAQTDSGVCFSTAQEDSTVCINYEDNSCINTPEERRRLSSTETNEDNLSQFRKNLFKNHLEAFRNGKSLNESALQEEETDGTSRSLKSNPRNLKKKCDKYCLEDTLVGGKLYTKPAEVYDVIIVGAGWAGLSAASWLKQKDRSLKIKILEANDYIGGRSRTEYFRNGKIPFDLGSEWITYFEGSEEEQIYELLKDIERKCEHTDNVNTHGLTEVTEHNVHRFFWGDGRIPEDIEKELLHVWTGNDGFEPFSSKIRGRLGKGKNLSYEKVMKDYFKDKASSLTSDDVDFLKSTIDGEITTFYGADVKDVYIKDAPLIDSENMYHMGGSYQEVATSFAKCGLSSNIYENISLKSKVEKIDFGKKNIAVKYYDVACEDEDGDFRVDNDFQVTDRTCKWVREKNTRYRCNHAVVSLNCPKTCDLCCKDEKGDFSVDNGIKVIDRNCNWARDEYTSNRCNNPDVSKNCPVTCNLCNDKRRKLERNIFTATNVPTAEPSDFSSSAPPTFKNPSNSPSLEPSDFPSSAPPTSKNPSNSPSLEPSFLPSETSSDKPSLTPSGTPSLIPSIEPSDSIDNAETEEKAVKEKKVFKTIYAKKVIVTASLGVLKSGSITFKPELPPQKKKSN